MKTRIILVTGAAGFAAGHLIEQLRSASSLRLYGWMRPGGRMPSRNDFESETVDLLDSVAVKRALTDVRPAEIYHLAAASHVGRAWQETAQTLAINVQGTAHLLEAVRALAPETRVLIPSSAMVYRPSAQALTELSPLGPSNPYGLSKLAQEMLAMHAARDDGQPIVVARAFNHIGPGQDDTFAASAFARQIATIEAGRGPGIIKVGNLDARRDFTDVRDTVRAYRLLLARGEIARPYNICSGRAHSIREILDHLLSFARAPVRVETDPALYRPQDESLLVGDSTRLRSELGWSPVIPIEQSLRDILDYWRGQILASP